ncbi:heme-binding protein [Novosphingobium sp. PS1R-30]|uniref:Heme-binding protein n=1 Tax=Novosphingobium anseongense TaxID=3133436 RepID=A0ABU8S2L1_9SPHN
MALTAHLPHRRHSLSLDSLRSSASGRRSPRRLAGELALGAAGLALSGFALYFLKERSQEEAEHKVVERDGAFSLRRYARLTIAEVRRTGTLAEAMDAGFEPLYAYISAKPEARQPGADKAGIAMTVPVTVAPGGTSADWAIRFVMPRAWSRSSLPEPAKDVTLTDLPPRTIAALRFSGRGTDEDLLARKRAELLEKVQKRGLHTLGEPEFAAYNAPIVPGALRRNEWWVEVQAK